MNGRRIVLVAAGMAACAVLSAVVASTLSARTNAAPSIVPGDGMNGPKGNAAPPFHTAALRLAERSTLGHPFGPARPDPRGVLIDRR